MLIISTGGTILSGMDKDNRLKPIYDFHHLSITDNIKNHYPQKDFKDIFNEITNIEIYDNQNNKKTIKELSFVIYQDNILQEIKKIYPKLDYNPKNITSTSPYFIDSINFNTNYHYIKLRKSIIESTENNIIILTGTDTLEYLYSLLLLDPEIKGKNITLVSSMLSCEEDPQLACDIFKTALQTNQQNHSNKNISAVITTNIKPNKFDIVANCNDLQKINTNSIGSFKYNENNENKLNHEHIIKKINEQPTKTPIIFLENNDDLNNLLKIKNYNLVIELNNHNINLIKNLKGSNYSNNIIFIENQDIKDKYNKEIIKKKFPNAIISDITYSSLDSLVYLYTSQDKNYNQENAKQLIEVNCIIKYTPNYQKYNFNNFNIFAIEGLNDGILNQSFVEYIAKKDKIKTISPSIDNSLKDISKYSASSQQVEVIALKQILSKEDFINFKSLYQAPKDNKTTILNIS